MHMIPTLGLSGAVYGTRSIQYSIHLDRAAEKPDSWLGEKRKGGNKPVRATTLAGYSETTFPSCREATNWRGIFSYTEEAMSFAAFQLTPLLFSSSPPF